MRLSLFMETKGLLFSAQARLVLILPFFLVCVLLSCSAHAREEHDGADQTRKKWALTLFSGIYTDRTFGQATFNIPGRFENKYMHSLALSREMGRFREHFSWELEGMFAKHHGRNKTGRQDYEEFVLAALVRYHSFPWDHLVDTTLAVGEGLSGTTETPRRELQREEGKSQNILNYLAVELEFTLPAYPDTSLVYRVHHRSGVFGLFGGVKGASDFYLLGIRHRF